MENIKIKSMRKMINECKILDDEVSKFIFLVRILFGRSDFFKKLRKELPKGTMAEFIEEFDKLGSLTEVAEKYDKCTKALDNKLSELADFLDEEGYLDEKEFNI